jgi:copper(I)-binding protein
MRGPAIVLACSLGAGLTGCSPLPPSADHGPRLRVTDAHVLQPPPAAADMAAGYVTIVNTGGTADRLTGVTCDIAAHVSLHTTEAGRMREVAALAIPARGRLTLRVGRGQLMLAGLRHRPMAGQTVRFVLRFAESAPLTVRVPVRRATYRTHLVAHRTT